MASVDTQNNPNDPNNPNNPAGNPNQVQTQGPNQPATSGGAGAVTPTGAANVTGQVVGTNNPSQPFQNISSYLAANAPQSQDLANQVATSVSQPISKAQSDITQVGQNFTDSVNTGYTPENTGVLSSVTSNPTTAAANPDNVAAFQSMLNDKYTGPTDITQAPGYSNLETEVANAQSRGTSALTPTGIQTLLQGVEGPATAGINNLDTLLLAQNPQNFQTIKQAGLAANTQNNALQNFLTGQTAAANTAAQTGATTAQQTAADAAKALNISAGNVAAPIKAGYESALTGTQNYDQELSSIINAIGTGNLENLTPQQQKEIGFNPQILQALKQYPQIFPSQSTTHMPAPQIYYSGPNAAILPTSAAQTETSDQAAAVAALNALSGGAPISALSGLSPVAPSTPYSAPTNFGAYNNTGLADFLYNSLEPTYEQYLQIPTGTPISGNNPTQINSYMALLAQLTNQSLPNPVPVVGGQPTGGPQLGPPGGDVQHGRA